MLANTVLVGSAVAAPAILALSYANYSNQGDLLVRSKGLQFAVFLILSLVLIPPLGPLGAAIAIVASDLLVQFGLLTLVIMSQTLKHPLPHVVFLAAVMIAITLGGWALGMAIRAAMPGLAYHVSSPNARHGSWWLAWRPVRYCLEMFATDFLRRSRAKGLSVLIESRGLNRSAGSADILGAAGAGQTGGALPRSAAQNRRASACRLRRAGRIPARRRP